jgi:4-hydroxy-3-methylbut-2-en-1-yl diphosphate synthase IspG/GcpE
MTGLVPHHGDVNGDRVVTCPKCGRQTIDVRRYVGKAAGDVSYIHAEHIAPPFGFILATDSCYVCARDAKAVAS